MKTLEIYTIDDLKKDLEEGVSEGKVAVKKWETILNLLKTVEELSIQVTSFCLKYQKYGCNGCPILKYDYPCGHPYATFTIFYQELRKLRALADRLYAILKAIEREERESRGYIG
ncbi:hypothetical protein B6U99_02905 [Candidatus Geothermarchaeota archaeon ex4572_27]|nr:MAG: hypothetical protein B6U99_02905 [Candidatus Geothermarchaeota archaeon ex4572_27]